MSYYDGEEKLARSVFDSGLGGDAVGSCVQWPLHASCIAPQVPAFPLPLTLLQDSALLLA